MKKTNLFETLNNEELSFIKGGTAKNLGAVVNNNIVDDEDNDDEEDEDNDVFTFTGIIGGLNATSATITP